ncbi:hypothetical protein DE161_000119 [Clostridium beijerinckii]|nr:hypothetical protein [Clostridium beijerinckii]
MDLHGKKVIIQNALRIIIMRIIRQAVILDYYLSLSQIKMVSGI